MESKLFFSVSHNFEETKTNNKQQGEDWDTREMTKFRKFIDIIFLDFVHVKGPEDGKVNDNH